MMINWPDRFTVYILRVSKAISLFFSVLRPCAGRFWTTKVAKQTKKISTKYIFSWNFHFWNNIVNAKVLLCSFDCFIYTLSWVFPLLINEVDQIFVVSRPHNMQRQLCFLKFVCFFPWLAGRSHKFELTQNREKTRNGLRYGQDKLS